MDTADIRWRWEPEDTEEKEAVETAVKEIKRIVGDLTAEQVKQLYQLISDLIDPIPF